MNLVQITAAMNDLNDAISHLERSGTRDNRVVEIKLEMRNMYSKLNQVRREERTNRRAAELQKEIKRDQLRPVLNKG